MYTLLSKLPLSVKKKKTQVLSDNVDNLCILVI